MPVTVIGDWGIGSAAGGGWTVVSDDFNRGDINPIGGNWTTIGTWNACQITNSYVQSSVGGPSGCWWNAATPTATQYAQIIPVNGFGGSQGAAVRVQTGAVSTCYLFQIDSSTQVTVYRIISDAGASLGSKTTSTITLGTTIVGLSVSGVDTTVTLKVYIGDYPGTQQGTDIIDTNAARIVTAGSVGFYTEASGVDPTAGIDNWAGGWS